MNSLLPFQLLTGNGRLDLRGDSLDNQLTVARPLRAAASTLQVRTKRALHLEQVVYLTT